MISKTLSSSLSSTSSNTPHSPHITSTLQKHSPLLPEIWLLVIPYLKSHDLQSISLTCSTFRYIAQPLLFSVLDVSPFLLSHDVDQRILRPQEYQEMLAQRLEHYKLPHIVHGVTSCWISPYSRSGFPSRSTEDDLDPNRIINLVLNTLPLFPNLAKLAWHCIDITPQWWSIIESLKITKLWINSADVPISTTVPLSHIEQLELDHWPWEGRVTNHVSVYEAGYGGVGDHALRHTFNADVIKSISVARLDTARRLYGVLSETTSNLRSLKVPFSSISSPYFGPALEHCQNLTSLCIIPPSEEDSSLDSPMEELSKINLPALTTYEGPYTHVLRFSRQPLKSAILWGFDEFSSTRNVDALIDMLHRLATTSTGRTLKTLKLSVPEITLDLLDMLAFFERLEYIVVNSQDNTPADLPISHSLKTTTCVAVLYNMLDKVSLPGSVKYFKLSTRLGSKPIDLAKQESDAAYHMEAFARRHASIQRIEIGYGIYWTGVYSATWGRLRDNAQYDYSEVETDPNQSPKQRVDPDALNEYSSKSSSREYIMSTVVSTVHPLPLGKLLFTEHRRTIVFANDSLTAMEQEMLQRRFWAFIWMRFRRLFGKTSL